MAARACLKNTLLRVLFERTGFLVEKKSVESNVISVKDKIFVDNWRVA